MLAFMLAVAIAAQPNRAAAGEAELVGVAKRHFTKRQYAEAIAQFQAAYDLGKSSIRLYNIGKCYERLGETGKALRYFREYLRLEPSAQRDDVLRGEIANAERRLKEEGKQQFAIFADPPTAEILVDEVRQGASPVYLELPTGEHVFVAKADGFETEERRIKTPLPGGSPEQSFLLRPAKAPADAPRAEATPVLAPIEAPATPVNVAVLGEERAAPPRRRVWTWVAGGTALAAGGAAIGLGAAYGAANKELYTLRPDRQTPETTALEKRTVGLRTGTEVAASVAGVALATAVVLFFVEGR